MSLLRINLLKKILWSSTEKMHHSVELSLHTKNKCHIDFCCQTSQRININDQLLSATFVLLTADSLCCNKKKNAATWIFCLLIFANEKKKRRSDGFMCIEDSHLCWCRTWLTYSCSWLQRRQDWHLMRQEKLSHWNIPCDKHTPSLH